MVAIDGLIHSQSHHGNYPVKRVYKADPYSVLTLRYWYLELDRSNRMDGNLVEVLLDLYPVHDVLEDKQWQSARIGRLGKGLVIGPRRAGSMDSLFNVSENDDNDGGHPTQQQQQDVDMREADSIPEVSVNDGDDDSAWTDDSASSMPPFEPVQPSTANGNRRARVDEDEDEERDRRHPSQRISNPRQSTTATPDQVEATAPPQPPPPQPAPRPFGFAITIDINGQRVIRPLPAGGPFDGGGQGGFLPNFLDLLTSLSERSESEDPERAKQLVVGLEEVPVGLIRRLEALSEKNIGDGEEGDSTTGAGDCQCAICWDRLLDGEGGFGAEVEATAEPQEDESETRDHYDGDADDPPLVDPTNTTTTTADPHLTSTSDTTQPKIGAPPPPAHAAQAQPAQGPEQAQDFAGNTNAVRGLLAALLASAMAQAPQDNAPAPAQPQPPNAPAPAAQDQAQPPDAPQAQPNVLGGHRILPLPTNHPLLNLFALNNPLFNNANGATNAPGGAPAANVPGAHGLNLPFNPLATLFGPGPAPAANAAAGNGNATTANAPPDPVQGQPQAQPQAQAQAPGQQQAPGFTRISDWFAPHSYGQAHQPEKKAWTLPPAPGPTLRQRIERREREAGLRCYDVSCGLGPSDEDPFATLTDATRRQLSIRAPRSRVGKEAEAEELDEDEKGGELGKNVCPHTFHPACLVSASRLALMGEDATVADGEVEVACSVCRGVGNVAEGDWDEGVQALA
ncbi:hypothetical protein C0991_008526 [Blastosporella zonata]|nr:hypothetical protein C0991_008526 [Blastosporella zonata]